MASIAELIARLVKSEEDETLEALVIRALVKNVDDDKPLTARDMKTSEIPSRRASKRHSDRVAWRGEQFTANPIRAIYQKPNAYNEAIVASSGAKFTYSPENHKPVANGNGGRAC